MTPPPGLPPTHGPALTPGAPGPAPDPSGPGHTPSWATPTGDYAHHAEAAPADAAADDDWGNWAPPAEGGATLHRDRQQQQQRDQQQQQLLRDQQQQQQQQPPPGGDRRARDSYRDKRGRDICRSYNRGQCDRPHCKFTHACKDCQGDHPAQACPQRKRARHPGHQPHPDSAPCRDCGGLFLCARSTPGGRGYCTNTSCTRHWNHPLYSEPLLPRAVAGAAGQAAGPADAAEAAEAARAAEEARSADAQAAWELHEQQEHQEQLRLRRLQEQVEQQQWQDAQDLIDESSELSGMDIPDQQSQGSTGGACEDLVDLTGYEEPLQDDRAFSCGANLGGWAPTAAPTSAATPAALIDELKRQALMASRASLRARSLLQDVLDNGPEVALQQHDARVAAAQAKGKSKGQSEDAGAGKGKDADKGKGKRPPGKPMPKTRGAPKQ
jgi:hypothetical protein